MDVWLRVHRTTEGRGGLRTCAVAEVVRASLAGRDFERIATSCGAAWGHGCNFPGYITYVYSSPSSGRQTVLLINDGPARRSPRSAVGAMSCLRSGREHLDESGYQSDQGTGAQGAQHGPSGPEEQERCDDGHREGEWLEAAGVRQL